jgi:predicted nucleic acid-binding Zn ribbon protein
MTEDGIMRWCVVCDRSFNCTDGDVTCSSRCSDMLEQMEEYERDAE